ncbi:MAG TPA: hypothetical protein VK778_06745 [Solirubrobacteraceae bacterium]|jgi:hypothetical protein|nr:hypothetical protein [Solirubrobacteraceae bacterium]
MSPPAGHSEQVTRRHAAQRVRAAGRSRRADAGAVTEMARSLLRDARAADTAEERCRRGGIARAERAVRRELAGGSVRLSSRPFADASASGRLSSRPLAARRA